MQTYYNHQKWNTALKNIGQLSSLPTSAAGRLQAQVDEPLCVLCRATLSNRQELPSFRHYQQELPLGNTFVLGQEPPSLGRHHRGCPHGLCPFSNLPSSGHGEICVWFGSTL